MNPLPPQGDSGPMLRWLLSPLILPLTGMFLGLMAVVVVLVLTLNQPWLGLVLAPAPDEGGGVVVLAARGPAAAAGVAPGMRLDAVAGVALHADDLTEEPDMLPDFATLRRFMARQGVLATALRDPAGVVLDLRPGGPRQVVAQGVRPPGTLPPAFWAQLVVGLFGYCGGAWIVGMRRDGPAERALFAAGVGLLLSAFAAAVYSTRELALPPDVFAVLAAVNHLGALAFGAGMIALFMAYPVALTGRCWRLLPAAILGAWWLAALLRLWSDPVLAFQLPLVLALAAIAVLIAIQLRMTRGDPLARAALRWFGLAVLIGAGAFVATIAVPTLLGLPTALSQGLAFLFFLPIYGGLLLGVARYRLFDLDEWAFRILFFIGAMVVLVALDALLIVVIALDQGAAFGLALLGVTVVYLPLREALARRLLHRPRRSEGALFGAVTDVALAPPGVSRRDRWQALLAGEFDPLRIAPLVPAPARPRLVENGAALELPAVDTLPGLRLVWARGGRGLFSRHDLARAEGLVAMLGAVTASRHAYEAGVHEERTRISRDMHDNIGIQLMGALHSEQATRKDSLIREALADLRDIIANVDRGTLDLAEQLADLRAALADHLAATGMELHWHDHGIDGVLPAPQVAHALRAILRETVSNAQRHSGGRHVHVEIGVHDHWLQVVVADDGRGPGQAAPAPAATTGGGHGLANIAARVADLGGRVEAGPGPDGGMRIATWLPLHGIAEVT